jgi:hypothetical protein
MAAISARTVNRAPFDKFRTGLEIVLTKSEGCWSMRVRQFGGGFA